MIIVLKPEATEQQTADIVARLDEKKLESRVVKGAERSVIAVIGNIGAEDPTEFQDMPGVAECTRISRPYKLASRESRPDYSTVTLPAIEGRTGTVGDVVIGGPEVVVMAGPCSVESREQLLEAARECVAAGATILRGGAFKPRTSPYAFQGLGEEGLKILAEARAEHGIPIVTELVSHAHVEVVAKYADIVQIGARNMQNFELLKAVSEIDRPILLKRGIAATIDEMLMAAEYILAGGNQKVILCERGIRTYEQSTRNTLDLSAIPVLRHLTHLPIIVDPSHGTGNRSYAPPMALAAVAAGADGVMLEVHPNPPKALSDGPQSLYPTQLVKVMRDIQVIAPVVGRQLHRPERRAITHLFKPAEPVEPPTPTERVAYQGQPGAFSERASRHFFGPEVQTEPLLSFRDVFEAVKEGQVRFGVLPIENSLTGSIHQNYDLLLEYNLHIVGEIKLRIVHALIALPGTKLEDIKTVYAHPQASGQCEEFLRQHPDWTVQNVYDTAGSVAYVKSHNLKDGAAIASPAAAELYGMQVLQEGIESNPSNFTRFIVVSRYPVVFEKADKTSIVFSTANQPGSLFSALEQIKAHGINMVKLESRPIAGKPWEYMFYVDLQTAPGEADWHKAMQDLAAHAEGLRVLGSYCAAG
jgi:3-deoxy-7-phosphoheptulonate synthase